MDIRSKQDKSAASDSSTRPSKEEIVLAKIKKKEQKGKRTQRAIQRERDRSTESYLGATSVGYTHRPGVRPAAQLHPGTLAFLKI